jgi:hypothetical protein
MIGYDGLIIKQFGGRVERAEKSLNARPERYCPQSLMILWLPVWSALSGHPAYQRSAAQSTTMPARRREMSQNIGKVKILETEILLTG